MIFVRLVSAILVVLSAAALPAAVQGPVWDSSGNGLLSGTWYFRDVIYVIGDAAGDLQEAVATYGTITFDGNGNYNIANARVLDSNAGQLQSLSTSGTYSAAASGYTSLGHPLSTGGSAYTIYGLVANGIFLGSATEDGFNELFVAAREASPPATNASFQGSYAMAGFFPSGTPAGMADASFQLNPDGNGNLGTFSVTGYFGGGGSTAYSQPLTNIRYSFSNGGANLAFPNTNSSTAYFFYENEYLYISADGNFVFGGSPTGWDLFVGVKTSSDSPNFSGLYYEAGLDETGGDLDTYYGAFSAAPGGNIVGHKRYFDPINGGNFGFTYPSSYPASITGPYTNASGSTKFTFGNNGAIRIGFGIGPYLGISVALQAPALTGSGVFLNPMGVVDAASQAPFTAGISPGEFIVLYGTNLAPGTQVANVTPFPTTLNGVQVLVDGIPAPIYYVSPSQISIIVPYGSSTFPLASIQVSNSAGMSNSVVEVVNKTTPGVFTLSANGLGYGAIEHIDGAVVTPENPALPGETVAAFLSGLGGVFPPVTEGSVGPVSPISYTTNTFFGFIGGNTATIAFAGLAPYLAGLYQVNITIPAAAVAGDNIFEIAGPDSDTIEAFIPVGSGSAANAVPAIRSRTDRPSRSAKSVFRPASPCFVVRKPPACQ
jgi:uncharacterized protein (TIGR03437 family)